MDHPLVNVNIHGKIRELLLFTILGQKKFSKDLAYLEEEWKIG